MRIVIDLQGAQTESRFRGIGRYSLSFAQAIVRNRGRHEVILALSGLFPETIEPIRAAFDGLLPQENIRVWYAPGPVSEIGLDNACRREVAELIREAFLASLKPDIIHICSLFEGYFDNAVVSIGRFDKNTPVSVSLYDLIPLLNPDYYLKPDPNYRQYYLRKIDYLRQAKIYLAISGYTRQEVLDHLGAPEDSVINVSTAIEKNFQPIEVPEKLAEQLQNKFGLNRPFVLYAGGADDRKNLPRLIQAFAALPSHLRMKYQLLLAGKISQRQLTELQNYAESAGLRSEDLCFTGYVSDEQLIMLYNLCELYIFPSWHEGFGLPALEAMACGAPVIGANTSSLPEVIGLDTALFNPYDVDSISAKMAQALNDESFRASLRTHGIQQAKLFSWDISAGRAIAAFEAVASQSMKMSSSMRQGRKPRLAFVSPLPPERTGIADYSAQLLPVLAEYYELELVVAQGRVDDRWINTYGNIRDEHWLRTNADKIDRVLYQVGNSPFHKHMLSLIQEIPGTVVLHDFYMSGLMAWQELHAGVSHAWSKALYESHGYRAVCQRYHDSESAKLRYPVNFHILQYAQGVIVHSEYSRKLSRLWYDEEVGQDWENIPLLRRPASFDKAHARQELGIDPEDFVVCSFGFLDSTKLNHRLLEAWLASALASDRCCKLFFVGENHDGDYGARLLSTIRTGIGSDRMRITGFASSEVFKKYLAAADMAVQLRTSSRGETSAAVLDSMNYALPLIVNANGSMAELDPEAVWMLPDEFDDGALVDALETLWRDPERRMVMGQHARNIILNRHAPATCAKLYFKAIERFNQRGSTGVPSLIQKIAEQRDFRPGDFELCQIANSLSTSIALKRPANRLLLDISVTCRTDLKTGIERVARALLLALLDAPPKGFRVEPVYLCDVAGKWKYRYARRYTLRLLDCPEDVLDDDVLEPSCGDVLLTLDLSGDYLIQAQAAGLFESYRNRGVQVYATVFDLLPVQMPEVFPKGADQTHAKWLSAISSFDGAFCISKAVADDLAGWLVNEGVRRVDRRPYYIGWFHLGADIANSAPSFGLPDNADWVLQELNSRPSFLMVGTIEPRKGYLETIKAFSGLWDSGEDVNLVIVGREGWKGIPNEMRRDIPETIEHLKNHRELNHRLFWLESISDEYLEHIYTAANCLIAASEGEGFGLPLIEAAQHGLPIIARDITIFREVAGCNAYFFKSDGPESLGSCVRSWLRLYNENAHPMSNEIPWLSWSEVAKKITSMISLPEQVETKLLCKSQANSWHQRIFIDISVVYRNDFCTGIQRVVRAILTALMEGSWLDSEVEVVPVYLDDYSGKWAYKQANVSLRDGRLVFKREFASSSVDFKARDILLCLDLAGGYVVGGASQGVYEKIRGDGAKVYFVVYDLLPLQFGKYFASEDVEGFLSWLKVTAEGDGVLCISKAVASDYQEWFDKYALRGAANKGFDISFFHLGADISKSSPSYGLPVGWEDIVSQIRCRPCFLMVGTIEPRKGHDITLSAFEVLWAAGFDLNLVIVGREGWMMSNFYKKLNSHPELNKRLFWLKSISDEFLEKIYDASSCLIAASEGEGFGLPLIEAAQHKLPIIARDISVFREVAGEHAYYFQAAKAEELASSLQAWLQLYQKQRHPVSIKMPWLTWRESAEHLMHMLLGASKNPPFTVKPVFLDPLEPCHAQSVCH